MQRKPFLKQFRFILPIGLAILLISSLTSAEDIYSVDLVTPGYIEASTVLPLKGDEGYMQVSWPFSFTFYKAGYTHAFVSTNGFLSFTGGSFSYINTSLPTTAAPNGAIYAFWDDLLVDSAASVRTQLLGATPNQRFVIEWRNVRFFGDTSNPPKRVDFEIVLYQNGVILLQYRNIDNDGREMGNSATVGVENEKGNSAVQVTLDPASFKGGQLALRFAQGPKYVPVDIKPRACPNRLDVDSHGVLHVAILGTSDLDVTTIDPKTVTMGGVAVLSKQQDPWMTKKKSRIVASKLCHQGWIHEDVGTPYAPFDGKTDPHQCNNLGPDGHLDLILKFDTQAIADSLGDVEDEEAITLQLRGQLLDGTDFAGEDVVIVKKEKRPGPRFFRGHDWDDRGHHSGHDKDRDHGHDKEHH
jgi:hypothetical protein